MPAGAVLKAVCVKDFDCDRVARTVAKNPEALQEVMQGLQSSKATIKYGCDKVLRHLSESQPAILYPHYDTFVANLDSDLTLLKWGAIHVLAHLCSVDADNRFAGIFDKYFAPISGPVLITAANTIKGAAVIAQARPELVQRITHELLRVERARYQSDECLRIALGQTIKSFDQFFDRIEEPEPVIALVKRQLSSSRNATARAAEKFLKKRRLL